MQTVVVGGGLVGAAAALSLAQAGHQVSLIEAAMPEPTASAPADWDLRISSVHQQNALWLQSLGIWDELPATRRLAYHQLSVQTRDGAKLSFHASEVNVSELGWMIENNALQGALWSRLTNHPQVTIHCPAKLAKLDSTARLLTLDNQQQLPFDLLLGCDGANSQVARLAGIGQRGWDYDQRCLLANVTTAEPIPPATWEVFREQGPYALLPLSEHQACLIDYRSNAELTALQAQGSVAVQTALLEQFHPHIGEFEFTSAKSYASFPLQRQRALKYYTPAGVVLAGDSAHSIHPQAGQGVNLGFADIQTLLAELQEYPKLALPEVLARYERKRMAANQRMMRAMDAIHVGFRSQHLFPRLLIGLGLSALPKLPLLKQWLMREALGLADENAEIN